MKPSFRSYFTPIFISLWALCAHGSASSYGPSLSMPEILNSAHETSLALKQAEANIQMRLADCWQAGLRINPELTIDVDNIGGRGGNCGFSSSGPSVAISQIFELGNKRSARQNAAAALASIALWDREILKQNLFQKITNLIIDAIAYYEKLKFLRNANENAMASLGCIAEKVNNGKASPILLRQSELSMSAAKIVQSKVEADLASVMRELHLLCGCNVSDIDEKTYPFFDFETPPTLEQYHDTLTNNPEGAKYRSVVYAAGENYQLQRANAIPDLEVTAGLCRDSRHRESSFLLEMNIVLPVFNRNQGNICRSSWESLAASYQLAEVEASMRMRCANLHDQLFRSFESVATLYNEALPAADLIINTYREGSQEGKYECLDILTAQGRHIELQIQLIDALTEFHHLKTDLHYLCGGGI